MAFMATLHKLAARMRTIRRTSGCLPDQLRVASYIEKRLRMDYSNYACVPVKDHDQVSEAACFQSAVVFLYLGA